MSYGTQRDRNLSHLSFCPHNFSIKIYTNIKTMLEFQLNSNFNRTVRIQTQILSYFTSYLDGEWRKEDDVKNKREWNGIEIKIICV